MAAYVFCSMLHCLFWQGDRSRQGGGHQQTHLPLPKQILSQNRNSTPKLGDPVCQPKKYNRLMNHLQSDCCSMKANLLFQRVRPQKWRLQGFTGFE